MGLFEASNEEIKSLIEWMDNHHKGGKDGKIDEENSEQAWCCFRRQRQSKRSYIVCEIRRSRQEKIIG